MQTIRALRQDRGWTQYELAIEVGVQPQAVYLWESGRRVPQVPQLRKLGQVFGLCSDEIDLEPPRRPPGPDRLVAQRTNAEQLEGKKPTQAPSEEQDDTEATADGASTGGDSSRSQ